MSARDRLIAWLGEVHAVPPFDVGGLIRDVEAAAEERGRRAGIEERDELRNALEKYDAMMRGYPSLPRDELIALGRAALAPRDSGKEK